jgi:hypothetical protein
MNVSRRVLLGVAGFLFAQAGAGALDIDIIEADIRRAGEIALSSEAARARFHAAYNVPVDDPTIGHIELITEFRRFVMEAERQNALGNWMMARGGYDSKGRTLKDILKESRGQLAIRVEVVLHPLHTYSAIPPFEITLGEPPFLPVSVARTPITRSPEDGGTLAGAVIEAAFNAPSIGDATVPVRVLLDGKQVVRVRVDLSRID